MRRATITIPDDLEEELNAYFATQEPAPSLTRLVQAALRRFFAERRRERALATRELHPARGPLRISVAKPGSGEQEISIEHDRHFVS